MKGVVVIDGKSRIIFQGLRLRQPAQITALTRVDLSSQFEVGQTEDMAAYQEIIAFLEDWSFEPEIPERGHFHNLRQHPHTAKEDLDRFMDLIDDNPTLVMLPTIDEESADTVEMICAIDGFIAMAPNVINIK